MTFEFDIEVRPEFERAQVERIEDSSRPVRDFSDEDVDQQLEKMLTRFGATGAPMTSPVEGVGDYGDRTSIVTSAQRPQQLTRDEERVTRIACCRRSASAMTQR